MRILYFTRDYTTHDRRFLLKLAESRHEVYFLRLENDGIDYEARSLPRQIQTINWQGGKGRNNGLESWLHLMPSFESVIKSIRPHLVHAGPIQSCGFMTALSSFQPFLAMSWGSDVLVEADQNEMWHWITRYSLNHSDFLLCDCQAVQNKVQQLVHYEDERIIQFPWGIDLQQFVPGSDSSHLKSDLGWDNSFVVLSTRSWEKVYGIDTLLEAFWIAYSQNPNLRLILLGDGSLAQNIQQLITIYGLEDVVHRPGVIPHMRLPDYFRAADLYLSCTHSDGTSISLLEAMATGKPVVVTDVPGNREWVVADVNGWLAPEGSSEIFAKSILKAASLQSPLYARISRDNRRVTEERANWDTNFAKLLAAYDHIEANYVY